MFRCIRSRVLYACTLSLLALAGTPLSPAQAPGVPIESYLTASEDKVLIEKVKVLCEARKLMDREEVERQIAHPRPAQTELSKPSARALSVRDLYLRARAGYVRIGWYYDCDECKERHLNWGGGYAVSADGVVVTCGHCIEPDKDMKKGWLVAALLDGTVLPVTAVLAVNTNMDAAIVRVEGARLQALPLNDRVYPGDAAYVWSDPLDVRGYFSSGVVNRFYWFDENEGDPSRLEDAARIRMNVSTEWAPGSSGSAILDPCGNVIGHVAAMAPLSEAYGGLAPPSADALQTPPPAAGGKGGKKGKAGGKGRQKKAPKGEPALDTTTLITLHEAVPARGVLLLIHSMDGAPAATGN